MTSDKGEFRGSAPGYEVLEFLGAGAMGFVSRARHIASGRIVALKFIQKDHLLDSEALRRFQREAEALILLKHPCLVEVFDVSMSAGSIYLAMELVEGQDLKANVDELIRIQGEAPSWDQVSWVFHDLVDTLAYCHQQGVLHRDVKPQNLVLDPENERAVLIDFGLIKRVEKETGQGLSVSLTQEGGLIGTPAFMSPEQLFPGGDFGGLGPSSDIWAFGATLFYTLTGHPPYLGSSPVEIALAMRDEEAPDLRELRPETPDWLANLCADCLLREQEKRPSIEELKDGIWSEDRGASAHGSLRGVVLAALVLVLAVSAVFFGLRGDKLESPRPKGEEEGKAATLSGSDVRIEYLGSRGPVVVVEDDASSLVGRFRGRPVPTEVIYEGRAIAVDKARFEIPLVLNRHRLEVPKTRVRGQWETRPLIVWRAKDRGEARALLRGSRPWSEAGRSALDGLGALTEAALGPRFRRLENKVYQVAGQRNRVLRFQHRRSGMILHWIPGGQRELRCFVDPDRNLVRGILAASRIQLTQTRPSDFRSKDLRVRAAQCFREEFSLVRRRLESRFPKREWEKAFAYLFNDTAGSGQAVIAMIEEVFALLRPRILEKYTTKRKVEYGPFLIAARELSIAEWEGLRGVDDGNGSLFPATNLGYSDLLEVLKKDGAGLRFPGRAEWLHALKGGLDSPYFWGADASKMTDYAWCSKNSKDDGDQSFRSQPTDAHRGRENGFGLSDMLGNVSEWAKEDWPAWVEAFPPGGVKLNVDRQGRRETKNVAGTELEGARGVVLQALMGGDRNDGIRDLTMISYLFRPIEGSDGKPIINERQGFRLALDIPELGL